VCLPVPLVLLPFFPSSLPFSTLYAPCCFALPMYDQSIYLFTCLFCALVSTTTTRMHPDVYKHHPITYLGYGASTVNNRSVASNPQKCLHANAYFHQCRLTLISVQLTLLLFLIFRIRTGNKSDVRSLFYSYSILR